MAYAYVGRKLKKREYRKLWIARINAGARICGTTYSRMIDGLKKAGVDVNRKVLADLAVNDMAAFKKLADIVGIPKSLEELGVKREDFDVLAANALKDVCGFTNPVQASHAEIVGIFAEAYGPR